jgi:RNA polymerase sigma factor (TIGR02999 family)
LSPRYGLLDDLEALLAGSLGSDVPQIGKRYSLPDVLQSCELANLSKAAFMTNVTQILSEIEHGDPAATERLLPIVYEELRKLAAARLAHEKPGQTLQATALVHEAYLRLVGGESREQPWNSRGHFFAAAAEAMRRILVNRARDKGRIKRGGERHRIDLDHIEIALDTADLELIEVDDAIQALASQDDIGAKLVKLRFFAGLTLGEAAESLGIPRRTADRHWAYARAWLYDQLSEGDAPQGV